METLNDILKSVFFFLSVHPAKEKGERGDTVPWMTGKVVSVTFKKKYRFFYLFTLFLMVIPLNAQESEDLTELDLEELMNIEVTSVSKKSQKLSDAAAAVFVITSEDIRRAGATSIPEALRMAPGLQVARIDANKWAISARGFNGRFANKLLVLIDGRSVYTPLYSGVFWNNQDTLMEDIDRIEVIRGPGATLWGANAVNGVINVITRHAKETLNGFAAMGAGNEERAYGAIRYGGHTSEAFFYRAYVKYFERDQSVYPSGDEATDEWDSLRGGLRMDWKTDESHQFHLMGESFKGDFEDRTSFFTPGGVVVLDETIHYSGSNMLARWDYRIKERSELSLKFYFDRTVFESNLVGEMRDTFDVDMDHTFQLGKRHDLLWGAGYRSSSDHITNSSLVRFNPDKRVRNIWSAFVQDDIALIYETLSLTLGTKIEENEYTGFEVQPNLCLMFRPLKDLSVWGAVSRAVRTPSRAENDLTTFVSGIPTFGNNQFKSERLTAYELGIRKRFSEIVSADVALFINDYDELRTFELEGSFPSFRLDAGNKMKGVTHGGEVALEIRPSSRFKFVMAYTFIDIMLELDSDSTDQSSEMADGETPEHQISLRGMAQVTQNLELDFFMRYTDGLPSQDVDGYYSLDLHLGYHLGKGVEISLVGQNLLDDQHPEFIPEILDTEPAELQRSFFGKVTFRF